ncbi:MAG: NAD-dependent epimerase/dehydratase family protein [Solirubrobacteraceae bacterium]
MRRCLVLGANGHLSVALVNHLKAEGAFVRAVGRGSARHLSDADEYNRADLRFDAPPRHFEDIDEVYQLAAEVGGLGYIQDRSNDLKILTANTLINLNVLEACVSARVGRVFFASSACVYPGTFQMPLRETDAYPANPQNEFGWSKLYCERIYDAYSRTYPLPVRIGRLHQVYGPRAEWREPRAKVVASLCRKIAELPAEGGEVPIWGDGSQQRSLTYITDAVEGIVRLMRSEVIGPVNLGSEEAVDVMNLAKVLGAIAGKPLRIVPSPGPVGARVRLCDGTLAKEKLGWTPSVPFCDGLVSTYDWVQRQVLAQRR